MARTRAARQLVERAAGGSTWRLPRASRGHASDLAHPAWPHPPPPGQARPSPARADSGRPRPPQDTTKEEATLRSEKPAPRETARFIVNKCPAIRNGFRFRLLSLCRTGARGKTKRALHVPTNDASFTPPLLGMRPALSARAAAASASASGEHRAPTPRWAPHLALRSTGSSGIVDAVLLAARARAGGERARVQRGGFVESRRAELPRHAGRKTPPKDVQPRLSASDSRRAKLLAEPAPLTCAAAAARLGRRTAHPASAPHRSQPAPPLRTARSWPACGRSAVA